MILLTVIAVGLLGLASIELRNSSGPSARRIALANAKMALMLAIDQLQTELGDDRRVTADGAIFKDTQNPAAVGIWNSWSPLLAESGANTAPDYSTPKSQKGFRTWLASATDPDTLRKLDWHTGTPNGDLVRLFTTQSSGFDLAGEKIPIDIPHNPGSVAWAITQENTKARINIGTDDSKRNALEDQLETPARPDLTNSSIFKQPKSDWPRRPATVCTLEQAVLDPQYGTTRKQIATAAKDYTASAYSLLTNAVKGGLKTDLNTGFEMSDSEFAADSWTSDGAKLKNPFHGGGPSTYKNQKPLYQPLSPNAEVTVYMSFDPASVTHRFEVNGVPTFDTLRSFYRMYRHLYNSSGQPCAFERPYAHIASPVVPGTSVPAGLTTQSSLAPVLDRFNLIFSIYAKDDGTLCILLTPFITIWNPYNIDLETQGLVVYPWIDFAVFWAWNVTPAAGGGNQTWSTSLSRVVGENYAANGRSTRPYFYLHLTDPARPVIKLAPGEVRVFCLAKNERRDLEITQGAATRTWDMKPVANANDIVNTLKAGITLNFTKTINNNFNYKLQSGDVVQSCNVQFDRNTYYYIVNMADSYQIRNPNAELMVNDRPSDGVLPALYAEKNLYFYDQIQAGKAFGKGQDSFTYPSMSFDLIKESPVMVGSLLTYHRVAQSGTLPLADLMFTTNPRQPFVTQFLGGGTSFQSGPHYESLFQGGNTLAALNMETTPDGTKAFYGPSQSAFSGKTNLAFFEVPRSPLLSLGALQHCDLTATAFGCPNQIGNSWASPYIDSSKVSRSTTKASDGTTPVTPELDFYDPIYLANEALFDGFFFSGAAPVAKGRGAGVGSPAIWASDQSHDSQSTQDVIAQFFTNPTASPLANPRMTPYQGKFSNNELQKRLSGPAACMRLAAHLMVEGGFNVNSASEEAWTAVLSSLRGATPASSDNTNMSRFRHILTNPPANMAENDPWSGFRTLSDADVKLLATNIVEQIKTRGPFLSLGEFVNRELSGDDTKRLSGAIQAAIDASKLNAKFGYSSFNTANYPYPKNIPNPKTGTNTPGWLSQADVLNSLAPFISVRSDSFIIRTFGEAKDANGKSLATVMLEAVVQRVPEFLDPTDDAATPVDDLSSNINKTFGRRFQLISVRELKRDSSGNPT